MKHILSTLTVLFIFVTPSIAFATSIGGKMRCTIKDEVIKEINDGKAASYNGYKNDLSVGDKFSLSYSIDDSGAFFIETTTPKKSSEFEHRFNINLLSEDTDLMANAKYNSTKAIFRPYGIFAHLFMDVRKDQFRVGYVSTNALSVRRYYKSDWMGIYTENIATEDPISAHTYSFICTHNSDDQWAEVFDKLITTALSRPHSPM